MNKILTISVYLKGKLYVSKCQRHYWNQLKNERKTFECKMNINTKKRNDISLYLENNNFNLMI